MPICRGSGPIPVALDAESPVAEEAEVIIRFDLACFGAVGWHGNFIRRRGPTNSLPLDDYN